ncbi:hypothetical protein GobsT_68920 [Gemmata obscuriglobus]|uniref:hypothetical protein n=1 Tax=Gemmata obscuriglobus TaxID=114 RepID=UPI00016C35BE
MTEQQWLASASPVAMLHHLNADGNARKPLLYAIAVCLREPELKTEALHRWVELAERYLRGGVENCDLDDESFNADAEANVLAQFNQGQTKVQYAAIADALGCVWITANAEYDLDADDPPVPLEELEPVRRANADLVRDIFGNPFRPVRFAPGWRTDTAIAIARQMYESRDFSAMPVLADALQDAGCDCADILAHCRDPQQVHVRGCWVADLVLGYE